MRADARRNLGRIVAAARELYAVRGVQAPMEEIARAAGVGVGTLYRHFPDRDALLRAVALDIFQHLADRAATALAEEPDGWSALCRVLREWVGLRLGVLHAALCQRMPDALRVTAGLVEARANWLTQLDKVVTAAQDDGELRGDVSALDLVVFMNMLIQQFRLPADLAQSARCRFLEITLAGLRAADRPLPGRPIDGTDLEIGW